MSPEDQQNRIDLQRNSGDEQGPPATNLSSQATHSRPYAAQQEITAALQTCFGYDLDRAATAAELLAVDEAILAACHHWLRTGSLDHAFRDSFPDWPCSACVPHPTLGNRLDGDSLPLGAFLRLAGY